MQKGLSLTAAVVSLLFLWDSIQDEGNNFLIINDFAEEIHIPSQKVGFLPS